MAAEFFYHDKKFLFKNRFYNLVFEHKNGVLLELNSCIYNIIKLMGAWSANR